MSSSTTTNPTLALFGATGGCCRTVLRHSLQAGLRVNVLARTPSKLTSEFPSSKYPSLTIVQGDIHDVEAVKKTLTVTEGSSSKIVDIIVSGIGAAPKLNATGMSDPTICEDGVKVIFAAIAEVKGAGPGPRFVGISSTGLSTTGRDVALVMVPVYKTLLIPMHADKRKMEQIILESGTRWCIVRPSHLTDGEAKGLASVKVGVEEMKDGKVELIKREIGYSIRREDVGLWIFEELVNGGGKVEWEHRIASLQY